MHRMSSVVVPLFLAVLACTACQRTDRERVERQDREAVSTTETTGARLDDKTKTETAQPSQVDTDKIRQDALEQGKAEGKSACEAEHADQTKKAGETKTKKAKPGNEEHSMTAPIPTPKPRAQPAPVATSETTITSAPMPEEPAPNKSTTMGNSQSGMYTGGDGTYGGKATWGTGAGAPKK